MKKYATSKYINVEKMVYQPDYQYTVNYAFKAKVTEPKTTTENLFVPSTEVLAKSPTSNIIKEETKTNIAQNIQYITNPSDEMLDVLYLRSSNKISSDIANIDIANLLVSQQGMTEEDAATKANLIVGRVEQIYDERMAAALQTLPQGSILFNHLEKMQLITDSIPNIGDYVSDPASLRAAEVIHDLGKLGPVNANPETKKVIFNLFEVPAINPKLNIGQVIDAVKADERYANMFPESKDYYLKILGGSEIGLTSESNIKDLWDKHYEWGVEWMDTQLPKDSPIYQIAQWHGKLAENDPVISIIDAYDALVSRPSYNSKTKTEIPPRTHEQAIEFLRSNGIFNGMRRSTQFEDKTNEELKQTPEYANYMKIIDTLDRQKSEMIAAKIIKQ
jgi:hypothetical protein